MLENLSKLFTMIILNNQFFFLVNLQETVEHYIQKEMLQDIVHLQKTNVREGLIRARIFGANLATGQVIEFIIIIMKLIF